MFHRRQSVIDRPVDTASEGVGPTWQMQPLGELARVRADEPPTPPTERLRADRQLNAIFALALLAAPSVRGCPMKADIAIFISETCFKANGGDFFAGADNRPSQNPGGPRALLQPPRLEEARRSRDLPLPSPPMQKNLQDFPKSRAKWAFNLLRH
jgi:hypothetical protein